MPELGVMRRCQELCVRRKCQELCEYRKCQDFRVMRKCQVLCAMHKCCMCLALLAVGISLIVAITMHEYYNIFTPVYETVDPKVGKPVVTEWNVGWTSASVAFRLPLTLKNPNPYTITLDAKQGQVVLEGSHHPLGVIEAFDFTVDVESSFTHNIMISMRIDEWADFKALSAAILTGVVTFYFEMASLQVLVQITMLGKTVEVKVETSRFCMASIDVLRMQPVEGADICSETREKLAQRIPLPDAAPEGVEDAEQQKNVAFMGTMMVGYIAALIFAICFLWHVWKACRRRPTLVMDICGDPVGIKQPSAKQRSVKQPPAVSIGRPRLSKK